MSTRCHLTQQLDVPQSPLQLTPERAKPVQVGFPRGIAESAQTVPLGSLSGHPLLTAAKRQK